MAEPRKTSDGLVVLAAAPVLLLAVLGVYFGGYCVMSELSPSLAAAELNEKPGLVRLYDAAWKAKLFKPAAKVESLARGRRVDTLSTEGWQAFDAWKE